MSLIDSIMEPCTVMVHKSEPDGSGGSDTKWEAGKQFLAAIVLSSANQAQIAETERPVSTYTITTYRDMRLKHGDAIKRLSDGKTFRITSDSGEKRTPVCAGLSMAQATAEAWRLPE